MAAYLKCVRLTAHEWQRINQSALSGSLYFRYAWGEPGISEVHARTNLEPVLRRSAAGSRVGSARLLFRTLRDPGGGHWNES